MHTFLAVLVPTQQKTADGMAGLKGGVVTTVTFYGGKISLKNSASDSWLLDENVTPFKRDTSSFLPLFLRCSDEVMECFLFVGKCQGRV